MYLKKLPDIVIIIGQSKESNAVRECQNLGIKTITLLDTDCDPTLTDLFVPANDDSSCSIEFLLNIFSTFIQKGKKEQEEKIQKLKLKNLKKIEILKKVKNLQKKKVSPFTKDTKDTKNKKKKKRQKKGTESSILLIIIKN